MVEKFALNAAINLKTVNLAAKVGATLVNQKLLNLMIGVNAPSVRLLGYIPSKKIKAASVPSLSMLQTTIPVKNVIN